MSHRHLDTIPRRSGLAGLLAGLTVLALAGVAIAAGTTLTTEKAKPGKVLVTSSHRSLYLFTKDSASQSACSGSCAKAWHALLASGKTTVAAGSGLNAKLLGTIKVAGGHTQITYNHHPLYEFSGDTKAGDIHGEGASTFGGHWYLVSPTGNQVKPKSSGGCPPGFVRVNGSCVAGSY